MRVVANAAFAHEAEILRKLRRQQTANTLAILVLVGGIVALAAFLIARSDAWHRPAPPAAGPAQVVVAPTPSTPPAPAQAPTDVAASVPVGPPAFVDPRPKLPSQPAKIAKPRESERARRPLAPEIRTRPTGPTVVAEAAAPAGSALGYASASAAKHLLVSIKCVEQFAFERQAKGRQYFSAVCESGFRRQVSCMGAGCRIEYDRPAPH